MTAPASVMVLPVTTVGRTYQIRTHGCQMNVHDSERLAGLLEGAGYVRTTDDMAADVVVFNTCAVRENADNRLYGSLGNLLPAKKARPGMQIAVGGCLAQKDRSEIVRRAPWVDVVFGTHNLGSLPVLLERARVDVRHRSRSWRRWKLSFQPADPAGISVRRVGVDQRWLQ